MNSTKELIVQKGRFVGVRGIAGDVTTKTRVAGKASALLEVHCQVNGVRVVTVHRLGDTIFIAEGDEVVLAGYTQAGVLEPMAWWNCAKNMGPRPRAWEFWLGLVASIIVLVAVAGKLVKVRVWAGDATVAAVILFFLLVFTHSAYRQSKATRTVDELRLGKRPVV